MSEVRHVDRMLDTVGTYCPVPVIRTARAIAEMRSGEILELIADDRGVLADIPDWCAGHGHAFLGQRTEGTVYHLYLQKS